MENSQLSKGREQGRSNIRNERWMKMFQSVTLVFLALFWIGYAVAGEKPFETVSIIAMVVEFVAAILLFTVFYRRNGYEKD